MDKKIVRAFAIATALVPAIFIVWSHTSLWPEVFARHTDTYYPSGPSSQFSDFVPSTRTGTLAPREVHYFARPITGSPIYLLFQPRRHSKFIRVEIWIEDFNFTHDTEPRIGYRHGNGPEDNIFKAESDRSVLGHGQIISTRLPFDEMTRERIDARRIVFSSAGASTTTPIYVTKVRLYYEDK